MIELEVNTRVLHLIRLVQLACLHSSEFVAAASYSSRTEDVYTKELERFSPFFVADASTE